MPQVSCRKRLQCIAKSIRDNNHVPVDLRKSTIRDLQTFVVWFAPLVSVHGGGPGKRRAHNNTTKPSTDSKKPRTVGTTTFDRLYDETAQTSETSTNDTYTENRLYITSVCEREQQAGIIMETDAVKDFCIEIDTAISMNLLRNWAPSWNTVLTIPDSGPKMTNMTMEELVFGRLLEIHLFSRGSCTRLLQCTQWDNFQRYVLLQSLDDHKHAYRVETLYIKHTFGVPLRSNIEEYTCEKRPEFTTSYYWTFRHDTHKSPDDKTFVRTRLKPFLDSIQNGRVGFLYTQEISYLSRQVYMSNARKVQKNWLHRTVLVFKFTPGQENIVDVYEYSPYGYPLHSKNWCTVDFQKFVIQTWNAHLQSYPKPYTLRHIKQLEYVGIQCQLRSTDIGFCELYSTWWMYHAASWMIGKNNIETQSLDQLVNTYWLPMEQWYIQTYPDVKELYSRILRFGLYHICGYIDYITTPIWSKMMNLVYSDKMLTLSGTQ